MRNLALLGLRATVGGYVAMHGAQKLFGSFGGPGLERAAGWFESIGLKPGKPLATLGSAAELGGGVLTATGIASPLGPLAIAGAMSVAATTHIKNGPLAQNGGYELPVTNLAAALALAATGPGVFRLGPRLSKKLSLLVLAGTAGASAYCASLVLNAARQAELESAATVATAVPDDEALVEIDVLTVESAE